jgi:hypothetical protein
MNNKRLMAWNRCYGCESFEVYIGYGETIEEMKKYYEEMGYYCWIETKEVDNN